MNNSRLFSKGSEVSTASPVLKERYEKGYADRFITSRSSSNLLFYLTPGNSFSSDNTRSFYSTWHVLIRHTFTSKLSLDKEQKRRTRWLRRKLKDDETLSSSSSNENNITRDELFDLSFPKLQRRCRISGISKHDFYEK